MLPVLFALAMLWPCCADEFHFRGVLGQPIPLHEDNSVPLVPVRIDDGEQRWALLDIGTSVTFMRLAAPATAVARMATVAVLDAESVLVGDDPPITRLEFPDHRLYDYDWDDSRLATQLPLDGIVGTDLLGRFAIELRLGKRTFTAFDSVPSSNVELAEDGWAVLSGVYQGGGRTQTGCDAPLLPARRLVVDACVFDQADGPGRDVTLAVTTGFVDLTVGTAAAARLPERVVRVGVTADSDSDLGPCEELARRIDGDPGAAVAWVDGDFPLVSIPDTAPALIAARAEVAGATAGLDGFLGTALLRSFRLRLDYPGDRLLLRCEDSSAGCQTRPHRPEIL